MSFFMRSDLSPSFYHPNCESCLRTKGARKDKKRILPHRFLQFERLENRWLLAGIEGFKWHDVNGNGVRDTDLIQGENPSVVFVVDVSGSTSMPFVGGEVGDVNGDGDSNTILDAQLAGFLALNQALIDRGFGHTAAVSVTVFGSSAASLDMNPVAAGVQLTTTPLADVNGNGVRDAEEILRQIHYGHQGVGMLTNFKAGLQATVSTLNNASPANGRPNVVFLSDGEHNHGGSFSDEVSLLRNSMGANLRAFGVGAGAELSQLRTIDPNAAIFTTTDELINVFSGLSSDEVRYTEVGLEGWTIYLDLNNNGRLDPGEPTATTDASGKYSFTGLPAGQYTVAEVQRTGWQQTAPASNHSGRALYIHDSTGQLATLDIVTGAVTVVGNMGVTMTDIAFDPLGNLYGLSYTHLYRINSRTAQPELIGAHGISQGNALVFSANGTLYAAGALTSNLYTLRLNTGTATLVGNMGYRSAGDLAFVGSELFLASTSHQLVRVDLSNNANGTAVGSIGYSDVFGLALADNGVVYGLSGTRLLAIDLATGSGTLIHNFGGQGFTQSYGASFLTEAGAKPAGVHIVALTGSETLTGVDFGNRIRRETPRDIAGRFVANGDWWVAESNGTDGFASHRYCRWGTEATWVDVMIGDFTGNGFDDIVGRVQETGDWWVAVNDGTGSFTNQRWGRWSPNVQWVDVLLGDFNGDGYADLAGRVASTGDWWVAKSNGTGFVNQRWGRWAAGAGTWTDVLVGDFNGDGRDDIAGRAASSGDWWVALGNETGDGFINQRWGRWTTGATWLDVQIGDFNADGQADIVGRVANSGDWWIAKSTGTGFSNERWGRWAAGAGTWTDVLVGDFNGDGRDDIAGRAASSGDWWLALGKETGDGFINERWGRWTTGATWLDVQMGDFNADGQADIVGRVANSGDWWIAKSTGTGFSNERWGRWAAGQNTWTDVLVGNFAPAPSAVLPTGASAAPTGASMLPPGNSLIPLASSRTKAIWLDAKVTKSPDLLTDHRQDRIRLDDADRFWSRIDGMDEDPFCTIGDEDDSRPQSVDAAIDDLGECFSWLDHESPAEL